MALPQSLTQLAELLGLHVSDIEVNCFYCDRTLTFHEKILFVYSDLNLFWRGHVCYAGCQSCLRAVSRLEFVTFYEKLVSPREAEAELRVPFRELDIRCVKCYRYLNYTEKHDVLTSNENVAIVRGAARALCILCKIGLG